MTYETEARREFEEFPRFWASEWVARWRRSWLSRLPGRRYSCHGESICFHYSVPWWWPRLAPADTNRDHFPAWRDDSLWSPLSTQNCLFSLDQWNNPNLSTTWQNILWARLGPMEMFIQSQSVVDINSVGISKSYFRYIFTTLRNEHVTDDFHFSCLNSWRQTTRLLIVDLLSDWD